MGDVEPTFNPFLCFLHVLSYMVHYLLMVDLVCVCVCVLLFYGKVCCTSLILWDDPQFDPFDLSSSRKPGHSSRCVDALGFEGPLGEA